MKLSRRFEEQGTTLVIDGAFIKIKACSLNYP